MEGDKMTLYKETTQNYFNPLPPHGGRPLLRKIQSNIRSISIHSLRMEGDTKYKDHALTGN